jgi:hypothetical protein
MFTDWVEYRDFLLERLILVPKVREGLRRKFASLDGRYPLDIPQVRDELVKAQVGTILANDFEGTKLSSLDGGHSGCMGRYRRWHRDGRQGPMPSWR